MKREEEEGRMRAGGTCLGGIIGWIISSLKAAHDMQDEIIKAESITDDISSVILRRVWSYNRKFGKYSGIGLAIGFIVTLIYALIRHPQPCEIKIEAGVLITLISTTTASVVGLLAIVMNWLFPKDQEVYRGR